MNTSRSRAFALRRSARSVFRPAVESLERRDLLAQIFWNTDSDGYWDIPGNWSTGAVPTFNDDVVIDRGLANPTVTIRSGAQVHSLRNEETVQGNNLFAGTTIDNAGTVTNNGTFIGCGFIAQFENYGTIIIPASVTLFNFLGVLNNYGLFDLQGDGEYPLSTLATSTQLNNYGTFQKSGGTATSHLYGGQFNNYGGSIDVLSGSLAPRVNIWTGGTFFVSAGSTLDLSAQYIPQVTGVFTATGSGDILLGNGHLPIGAGGATFAFSTARFLMTGGAVDGTGTLTSTDTFEWQGGSINTPLMNVGTVKLTGWVSGTSRMLNSSLINSGAILHKDSGPLTGGGTLNNLAGSLYDVQADGSIGQPNTFGASLFQLNNSGTFRKSAGSGSSLVWAALNNAGSVEVQSGTLDFRGSGTCGGGFSVAAGSTLLFSLGSFNLSGSSNISGAGDVSFIASSSLSPAGSVNVTIGGTFQISGTTRITGFTSGNGSLKNFATATFNGAAETRTLILGDNGTLGGNGTVNVTGVASWTESNLLATPGKMIGTGKTVANRLEIVAAEGRRPLGSLNRELSATDMVLNVANDPIGNPAGLDGTGMITILGQASWFGGKLVAVSVSAGASVTTAGKVLTGRLANDGQINLEGQGILRSGFFDNRGTITKRGDATFVLAAGSFNNYGLVSIDEGTLALGSDDVTFPYFVATPFVQFVGGTTSLSGGTFDLVNSSGIDLEGGDLIGNGTITGLDSTGYLYNSARVAPGFSPGAIDVDIYEQASTGVLDIEISPTDVDRLDVANSVSLNGGLRVTALDGYIPKFGDRFVILRNDGPYAINGEFAGLPEGAAVPGLPNLVISYVGGDGNDVELFFKQQRRDVKVTVTGGSFVYDGLPHPATSSVTSGDGLNTEARVNYYSDNMLLAGPPVNAGTYRVVATYDGDNSHNSGSAETSIIITPAGSYTTVTAANAIYDGLMHAATAIVTGAGGLSEMVDVTYVGVLGTAYGPTSTAPVNAGTYIASASYSSDTNHFASSDTESFAISKAALTVIADNKIKFYGEADPVLTYSVSGLVSDDTPAVVSGVMLSSVTGAAATVGTHPIFASGGVATNYEITDANGTLTVIIDPGQGILLLDTSAKGSLTVTGTGGVNVTGGGKIVVDSQSAQAVTVSGNGNVSAAEIDAKGISTSGQGIVQGTIDNSEPPLDDPLKSLVAPSVPSTVRSTSALIVSGGVVTLQPGLYVGGIKISGQAQVTLAPGIYYLQGGGFSVAGQASVTGTDVMLYNAAEKSTDNISFSGQGKVGLTGLAGGIYQGIAIFQERHSSAAITMSGNGNVNIVGTVYAAAAAIKLSGNGSLFIASDGAKRLAGHLLAADLQVTGNGGVFVDVAGNSLEPGAVDYFFANY
jgi:hypothetical protein